MTRTLRLTPLALLVACASPVSVEPVLVVVSISPTGGAAQVAVDTEVVVSFNHSLDEANATSGAAWIEDDQGDALDSDAAWTEDALALILSPTEDLDPATTYEIVLSSDLYSPDGGYLAAEVRSSFTTLADASGNELPVADAGEDQSVVQGDEVHLDGSGSFDPEGEDLTFSWWFESAPATSTATLSDPGTISPAFVVDVAGEYILGLIVHDGVEDSSPDYVVIAALE